MKESAVYAALKKDLGVTFWIRRIEDALSAGMLDVLISKDNATIYVELKRAPVFELDGGKLRFIKERLEAGCFSDMFFLCLDDSKTLYGLASAVDIMHNPSNPEKWMWIFISRENVGGVFHGLLYNLKEKSNVGAVAGPPGVCH